MPVIVRRALERMLFASRWLLVCFYAVLVLCVGVLLVKTGQHAYDMVLHVLTATETQVILEVLGLVDLTLTASLIVIVIFSGYENFVSRIDPAEHASWPEWMTQIDFAGLKLKLVSSIVAIAAIHLLRHYLEVGDASAADLKWHALILLCFVVTGVLLAVGDKIGDKH